MSSNADRANASAEEEVISLEREIEETKSRLWKFEEKVMDLTSKLEVSRENVKVLKRGYAEKAAEMEGRHIAKEEILRRKLEEAEAKLQSAEQEMEEKDSLIDELQGILAGQANEAQEAIVASMQSSTEHADRIKQLEADLAREQIRSLELERGLAEAKASEEAGRSEKAESDRTWEAAANARAKASEDKVANLEARLRLFLSEAGKHVGADALQVGDLTFVSVDESRVAEEKNGEEGSVQGKDDAVVDALWERLRASEMGYQAVAQKLDEAVAELRIRDQQMKKLSASQSQTVHQALQLADEVRDAAGDAEVLRSEMAAWHEALKEHTICMMRSSRRHTREWRTLYDELLAAYASATRRLAEFDSKALRRVRVGTPDASTTAQGRAEEEVEEEKEALSREVSMLRGRLETAEQELQESSELEESICISFNSIVEGTAAASSSPGGQGVDGREVERLKQQLAEALEGVKSVQQNLNEGMGEVEEEIFAQFQRVRFADSVKTPTQAAASMLGAPQSAATQFSRRSNVLASLAGNITDSDASDDHSQSIGSYHSEFASPTGGHADAMEDGGDWQAVTMTPARRRSPVVMSSSKRVRAPPAGLQELLEDCGSDEEEDDDGGRHVKPFGEWAKGKGLGMGMDELAGVDEGWT